MQQQLIHIKWMLILGVLFSCVLFACSPKDRKQRIGFSQCCIDDWRESMEVDIKREVSFHTNLELIISNAGNNSEQQIRDIRNLVNNGIDVLIVSPNEGEPLTPILDSVYDSGVPVILLDRKTSSSKYSTYIGANNEEIGREAARYLNNKLPEGVRAIQLQLGLTMSPAIERTKGFSKELMSRAGNILVGSIEDKYGIDSLRSSFINLFKKNPFTNAIYAQNDRLAGFVSSWLNEINPNHNIFIVGVDGLIGPEGGVQMILDSQINASVNYPTGAEESVAVAIDLIDGRKVPKKIELETSIINADNARMLQLQGNKLLSQQLDIERQSQLITDQFQTLKNQKSLSVLLGVFSLILLALVWIVVWQLRQIKSFNKELNNKNLQVSQQHKELQQLSQLSEEAHREKVEFFTNISHEFKTPLTLILAPTEEILYSDKSLSKNTKDQLKLIRKNALRMQRLIGQLMDFRRIDSGKIRLNFEEIELISFLKDIMSVFVNLKESKNIDFKFISNLRSSIILADKEALDKVFFNLLSNAFKFTADDGFIHVQLAESKENDQVVVKISDNGRGMSKEHAENAFERFYQGENYSSRGTGLGLSLSKELIGLHNGEISVTSEKGIGTTFTIRLPQHPAVDLNLDKPITNKDYTSSVYIELLEHEALRLNDFLPEDSKLFENAILIIEDNEDLLEFLKLKLHNKYRVFTALNGEEGIQIAEANLPNLIICDLMLPKMQGDEVVHFLKDNVMTSHIPIIMLSAKDSDNQKQKSFAQGVYDFVSKPFNHEVLLSKIDAVFKNLQSFKTYYGRELIYDIAARKNMNHNERVLLNSFDGYIKEHYHNPNLNVDEICKEMAMSKVQLYRKIKAITGITINEYIQSVRIESAKDLLSNTQLNLSEIAHKCGFNSSSYFSTSFKNAVGQSPSEWKKSTITD